MMKYRSTMRMAATIVGSGAIGLGAYVLRLRPWFMRWGATLDEARRTLPGDEIAPPPPGVSTRAVTINAPPEAIWPWLVQLGWGRGGFYSYNWFENLLGGDLHNAEQIHPQWQHLAVGDIIWMAPPHRFGDLPKLEVITIEPQRTLVVARPRAPAWAFVLEPLDGHTTRLIVRSRSLAPTDPLTALFNYVLFEPIHFLMERGMLLGIKRRAERGYPTLLDQVMPVYEWEGAESVMVYASPAAIFHALHDVTLADMPLARALGELRYLPGRITGQVPPASERTAPFVGQLLHGGSVVLGEEPNHEIVIGMIGTLHNLRDQHPVPLQDAPQFHRFNQPDFQKLAIAIRVAPHADNGSSTVTMEHRTHALSAGARWKFTLYWWLLVKVGSAIMSRLMLRAMKQRAERETAAQRDPAERPTLIDRYLPTYDATLIEQTIVEAGPEAIDMAIKRLDQLMSNAPVVRLLGTLRMVPERIVRRFQRRNSDGDHHERTPDQDTTTHGPPFIVLADEPGKEIVFGLVGRFWERDAGFVPVAAPDFAGFNQPGYAKTVLTFAMQPCGAGRTLLTIETRTATTDVAARTRFRRYWRVIGPGARLMMRQLLALIKADAEQHAGAQVGAHPHAARARTVGV